MWLNFPFTDCPSCKATECCGYILHKNPKTGAPQHLLKVCKNCKYNMQTPLATLDKKVIYLDQFFVSEVLKLNPIYRKGNKNNPHAEFYKQAWEMLTTLVKSQLIICPYSWFHKTETLSFSHPNDLQKVYEKISGGISFLDPTSIFREEIIYKFRSIVSGENVLTIDNILNGDRNKCLDRFIFTVPLTTNNMQDNSMQNINNTKQLMLNNLFKKCTKKTVESYQKYFETIINELVINCLQDDLLLILLKKLLLIKLPSAEEKDLINDFIKQNIPDLSTVQIMAAIITTIAHTFASGRKSVNEGMFNDINMVSSILPYCDAIFIDQELYELLKFKHTIQITQKYQHKIFSLKNKDAFLEYLRTLGQQASDFHKAIYN